MDSMMLYNIIYALAARDGREAVLFDSNYAALAREAFAKSLAGNYFPELWFEFPLKGDPWLDLHALVAREDLNPQMVFDPNTCGGVPDVFAWFAKQDYSARQLALSWDTSSGDTCDPAVQLLRRADNTRLTCDFLVAAQRSDAVAAYEAFEGRLPESWFACYTGVFPKRSTPFCAWSAYRTKSGRKPMRTIRSCWPTTCGRSGSPIWEARLCRAVKRSQRRRFIWSSSSMSRRRERPAPHSARACVSRRFPKRAHGSPTIRTARRATSCASLKPGGFPTTVGA